MAPPRPRLTASGPPPRSRKTPTNQDDADHDEHHVLNVPRLKPSTRPAGAAGPSAAPARSGDQRRGDRRRHRDRQRRQDEDDEQRDPGRVAPPVEARAPRPRSGERSRGPASPSRRRPPPRRRVGEEAGPVGLRDHATHQRREREARDADREERPERRVRDRETGVSEPRRTASSATQPATLTPSAGSRPRRRQRDPRGRVAQPADQPADRHEEQGDRGPRSPAGPTSGAPTGCRPPRTTPAPGSRGSAPAA